MDFDPATLGVIQIQSYAGGGFLDVMDVSKICQQMASGDLPALTINHQPCMLVLYAVIEHVGPVLPPTDHWGQHLRRFSHFSGNTGEHHIRRYLWK
ncbi:hypothetical protein ACIPZF_00075 [Pseudomonas sp. NPDC089752]|uniref:hypothetical protein n=1 Tax=Pseudomonas sp. NPDC089752 TaxID=3364472 RepID=UPI00380F1A37